MTARILIVSLAAAAVITVRAWALHQDRKAKADLEFEDHVRTALHAAAGSVPAGMPPRHPDWFVSLSDDERAVWEAFEDDAPEDVGLTILSDEETP